MYQRFFGLKQIPFSIAPDPRYLFMSERHREALAHLLYGLNGGGGFVLLTGEIGAGKTTVCRLFLEQIPARCNVAYIFNPKQTVIELLQSICDEFGVRVAPRDSGVATVKDFIDPLNTYLLKTHAVLQNNVLIIDEAQNLSADVLEQLRLLTNLETNERKLLQIILIGQPELRTMLAKPELEQLAQRVIARFHLDALSVDETALYIAHRLAVAGSKSASPFSRSAMRRIHQRARGIPRRINLLCDRALLGAYAGGKQDVDARTIETAAREVFSFDVQSRLIAGVPWHQSVAGVVVGALIVAGAVLALERQPVTSRIARKTPAVVAPPVAEPKPAPVVAPATPPKPVEPIVLSSDVRDLATAYRRLGRFWQLTVAGTDPCRALLKQQVYCFVSSKGLDEIRELDRPVILTLRDDEKKEYYALLAGLETDNALLQIGGVYEKVTLAALERRWAGEYHTLWRGPAGYHKEVRTGDRGPEVDWLAARIATINATAAPAPDQPYGDALGASIRQFQQSQGLQADGIAGPKTFMRLAAAGGVAEPHLQRDTLAADATTGK
ncbi:general secretion pathway protein A [Actimicrobium sp. GrIS 1.19]|uniref:AAA family ATPase n=1 Tax=Actimicrobium sp. GrIS 1.19 TaxID=3071708 RepID=UPI002DF7EBC0|nr:general secretion pathway protein A [Actimicrobium sp. GrIS 1.19]